MIIISYSMYYVFWTQLTLPKQEEQNKKKTSQWQHIHMCQKHDI